MKGGIREGEETKGTLKALQPSPSRNTLEGRNSEGSGEEEQGPPATGPEQVLDGIHA